MMRFDEERDNVVDTEQVLAEADQRDEVTEAEDEYYEDEGQPDEYTEWQEDMGGDEYYDHSEHSMWWGSDSGGAGGILGDVGKVLEYGSGDDEVRQARRGKALRHPFTGVHLALSCGVPDRVCHIIATHAGEGDLVSRSPEAFIVHHADFMTFEPFRARTRG